MALLALNWNPDRSQLTILGWLWLPLLLVTMGVVALVRLDTLAALYVTCPLAVLSMLVGRLAPRCLRPVFVGLLLVTFPIGFVVSHLVMLVVFFLVLTPMALVMRLAGRDALGLRFDRQARSYWIPHPAPHPVSRYFRQS